MDTKVTIQGVVQSLEKRTFTNDDGEEINFNQLSILTDDSYKPLMRFTVADKVLSKENIKDFQLGKKIKAEGTIKNHSRQINGRWLTYPRITIDKSLEILKDK